MATQKPHGRLRRSQIITTYGPGAMVDLPTRAVLIGGLDDWTEGGRSPVFEDRLVERLKQKLEVPSLELFTPPADAQEASLTGIRAWIFPEWFVGPYEAVDERPGVRSRPLVHREKLVNFKYQKKEVVPVRFVQGCVNGHLDDLDWYGFVHGPEDKCRRQLWMDEKGTTGDLAQIEARCDCGKRRSLATAEFASKNETTKAPLGYCRGRRPWLGARSAEVCRNARGEPEVNRLLARTASNAWFAETLSAISIPDPNAELRLLVQTQWDKLKKVTTLAELDFLFSMVESLQAVLGAYPRAQVLEAIQEKRDPPAISKGLKYPELEMLLGSAVELGEDRPEGDFYARQRVLGPNFPFPQVERVVLVHRLREVMALLGFTRFEAPVPDVDDDGLGLEVRRATLARDLRWLPAVENRGEGIFIGFRADAVEAWARRPGVLARWDKLRAGQAAWKQKNRARHELPAADYMMLHSLSHLLLTSVALDCGYAATAIRERIYALPGLGYGILLYTGSADAEGTLGGLVEVGRNIEIHLYSALERGRLCSHDPVCAQHKPQHPYEERFLHGAACHGCLLVSETSCEARNELLDRSLVVPTVDEEDAAFFGDNG